MMSECGAPIYPLESKSVLRYYRRSKVGRGAQLDASLIGEALMAISTLMLLPSSELGGGTISKSPSASLLWHGFILSSVEALLSTGVGGYPLFDSVCGCEDDGRAKAWVPSSVVVFLRGE
jgi:hypothetical protein